MYWLSTLSALAAMTANVNAAPSSRLPIINLGYVKQQASAINTTGGYVNFTNIAYAQPPLGELRFAGPQPPKQIHGVQDGGTVPKACPQGTPSWLAELLFKSPTAPPIPQSEDCLYLDVMVPQKIFEQDQAYAGAPVLVWIHGGGDVLGSKTSNGDPAGLIARSIADTDSEGVIYVAPNYRLGAFGFLGGPEFRSEGGTPNVGLLDQGLALRWIQQHISKFGGDPSRVTAIGESGGGSSIARQIAFNAPIQQAIFQSPTELPLLSDAELDTSFKGFLKSLGVQTLQQARKLSTTVLQTTNANIVNVQPTGIFGFGPSRDVSQGITGTATQELISGKGNHNVKIMTAHNLNEGFLFTPLTINSTFDFTTFVRSRTPAASTSQVSYIVNTLYPPVSPSTPYTSQYGRALLFDTELYTICNEYGIEKAFGNSGYAYRFSVPPGYHTFDTPYTFYNGPSASVANATVAVDMQTYFTNFAVHGNPNAKGNLPGMPIYGSGHTMLNLTLSGFDIITDPAANPRCDYFSDPANFNV